jgi:hypothetical protein
VVYAIVIVLRDPALVSINGLLFVVLLIAGESCALPVLWRLWQSSVTFVVTPPKLVVVHQILRTRSEFEWSAIQSVRRASPSLWTRGAAWRFTEISIDGGRGIVFGPHLSRYSDFLRELRSRALNCREFDQFE